MQLDALDIERIDAVFISSAAKMLALPFLTMNPKFTGVVYATDPTVQLGKLLMEEVVISMEQVSKDPAPASAAWRQPNVFRL